MKGWEKQDCNEKCFIGQERNPKWCKMRWPLELGEIIYYASSVPSDNDNLASNFQNGLYKDSGISFIWVIFKSKHRLMKLYKLSAWNVVCSRQPTEYFCGNNVSLLHLPFVLSSSEGDVCHLNILRVVTNWCRLLTNQF